MFDGGITLELLFVGSHALTSVTAISLKQSVVIQVVGMAAYVSLRQRMRSKNNQIAWMMIEAWFMISVLLVTLSSGIAAMSNR